MAFSQNLAMSGASQGLIEFATSLPLTPIFIFIAMQFIVLVMGMFMEPGSILMVAIPLFLPIVYALGFDPAWFAVVLLLNIEMAVTSPPFGLVLFVMKGIAPADTTIGDIYRGALPFLGCDLIVMVLLIAFPTIALWLPRLIR
jgi:TRAP-type C4-dicarboxylate transport system permease large subunit